MRRLSHINSMSSVVILGCAVWVQEGNWQRYPYSWLGFGQMRTISKRVKEGR